MRNVSGVRRPWLTVLILLGSLSLAGCGADVTPRERLARAQQLQEKGDYRAAVLEYKLVLQNEPDNLAARWALGQVYLKVGNGQAAEKEIKYVRKNGKDDHDSALALAQAYLLTNSYRQALEALDNPSVQQDSPTALAIRGEAALGLKDLPTAETSFHKSLQVERNNPVAHRGLAKLALIGQDFDQAEKHLALALNESSQDAQSWMLKGEVALSKRDAVTAEEYFSRAVQLDDNSFSARVGLVRALLEQQKTEQTREHLDYLAKHLPDHPLVNYLTAVAAKQRNDLTNAKSALLRVRNVQPDHLPSMLLLGSVHYLLQEYEQAAQELRRYVTADSDHVPARKLLAASLLKLNNPVEAIEALKHAEQQVPGDVQLLTMLGNAYIARGDHAAGMAYLEKAVALAPDAMDIRLRLASGQLARGDSDKAIAELNSAIEIDPDFLQAEVMLGLIHIKRGEYDKTLESARRLALRRPDSPLSYNLMAAAYEGKQDVANARVSYEKALSITPNYTPALLNLARLDLKANDPNSARQRYETVLTVDRHNEQALIGLAKIARDQKRYQDALQLLDRARWHNPTALQPRLILSEIHLQDGNAEQALELIAEAAKLAPREPRVLLLLGQSHLALGNRLEAREAFEKLVKLHPDSADAHFRLSIAQLANKDVTGARNSLRQAVKTDSAYLPARIALGNLELESGNMTEAERIAMRLKEEYPKSPAGHVLQGDVQMHQNRPADAAQSYSTAYAVSPNRPLLIKLFKAEQASGDSSRATAKLRAWLDANPKDIAVRLALAQSLQQNGKAAEAAAEYESVLRLQQANIIALNNLAGIYLDTDSTRSLELAKQAHDLAPENPNVLDTYGWALVKTGSPKQGLRILKSAVLGAPDNRDIRFHLAAARVQTGDYEQARNELQSLIADGKPFAERASAVALLSELQRQ